MALSSNSSKLIFHFTILVSCFFIFPPTTTEASAEDDVTYVFHFCEDKATETSKNTTFQVNNVKILLSSLSSNARVRTFYNTTVGGGRNNDSADTAFYGLFMCRGDIAIYSHKLCEHCVLTATQTLSSESSECYLSKKAVIWFFECMVRYSNFPFFSIEETLPGAFSWKNADVSNQKSFMPLLEDTLNKTIDEASSSSSPPIGDKNRYFATKEAKVSENQTLYCLAQCTQDLSPQDCSACLINSAIIGIIQKPWFTGTLSVRSFFPSCNLRYEFYPFYYRGVNAAQGGGGGGLILRATKHLDSKSSEDYLSHNCSSDNYDGYRQEISTLISDLSSKATTSSSNNGIYQTQIGDKFFSLFMCHGDIPSRLCGQCVSKAAQQLVSKCHYSEEAIVWYNHCLVRYALKKEFYSVSTTPKFDDLNVTRVTKVNNVEDSFKFTTLSNVLARTAEETAHDSDEKYLTKSFVLNDNQTVYVQTQCTQDLPNDGCYNCLYDIIGSGIPWTRLGSVGGRVLYPSCTLRFELFKFYKDVVIKVHAPPPPMVPPHPSSPPTTDLPFHVERKDRSRTIILVVVSIIVSMLLFSFCCYLLRKKVRRRSHILKENFGHESTTVEPLQFDLAIIKAATNNFSRENKIGKGGFGEVYKGILPDGRHIAVKILSKSSRQGITEFKNEILLIAKLQHRNLVAFIGFCLEEEEKILIYEYVPNKSLDYFLFDSHSEKLNWSDRHKIMEGIARGILYLHDYSRLKIIHRDLKPSNVLLDENMNPKISDFGLAKIIEIDQQEGATNKIVGTLGYMSPEYVIRGQFSEKSDVFSFGVMVLEIITGKKNVTSHESRRVADGLLSLVWRQFKSETPLSILDPEFTENCHDEFEVIRCIQIGLLCVQEDPDDRPTMMAVVSYFNNRSIELPSPQEPAFFPRHNADPKIVVQDYSSSSSINMLSTTSSLITPR